MGDIVWLISEQARPIAAKLRTQLGDEQYREVREGLKKFLSDYFSTVTSCDGKQGKSISPIKSNVPNAKGLKVRFGYPGCGKSGGLRLAVLAFCEEHEVRIAGAWIRKQDPDTDEMKEAFRVS